MSDTTDNANNPNNLMSKFQKLQSETNEIQSIFSKVSQLEIQSSFDATSLSGNRMLKDFCESMINREKEQNKFNEELMKTMKAQNTELTNLQNEQDKFIEENFKTMKDHNQELEHQNSELKLQSEQVLKEIRSIKSDLEELKNQYPSEIQSMKKLMNVPDSVDSSLLPDTSVKNNASASVTGKEFVLKHVFENASKIGASPVYSEEEEHFNIPWKMYVYRNGNFMNFCLHCSKSLEVDEWSAQTSKEYSFVSNQGTKKTREFSHEFGTKNGNTKFNSTGWNKFVHWEILEKDYVRDGKLRAEIRVKITDTTGLYGKPLRNFDERNKSFSDVVIKVKEKKFYVFKLLLVAQSAYFKWLLSEISPNGKVKLSGIESEDFQVFLEVLHGEPAINENTVEVVLYLAEKYDTHAVTKKCEQFLIDGSEKKMKKKLQLATKYKLEQLKEHCFDNINTAAEIRSMISSEISEMDPLTMASLFQKSLALLG
ncbi:hypothetical protein CRE_21360 [Caenorhabditis remanei]|uniref:BTB domain-containing protein n=1 Tax=Caenorhabditis remanei TaxID=31234 RepID=E3MUX4_CAERE|nr:hypothetical protein CRE_21360 [Caenorhabditis remanei]